MSSLPAPPTPPNHTCPLCGGPNACGSALSASQGIPCWCETATFTPALLARVPEAHRRVSCICAACAAAAL